MGKKTRLRERYRQEAERSLSQRLERHSASATKPQPVEAFADFSNEHRKAVDSFHGLTLRSPNDWRCAVKSRTSERRFIDLVRFTFARYRVSPHLEAAWFGGAYLDLYDGIEATPPAGLWRVADLREWYITVAQGGSLHRLATRDFLSKAETHHFLAAPPQVATARRALWYALARAQGANVGIASAVAQTKIEQFSIASAFWKEVARFFARNPLPRARMDDMIDFLLAARREDENFSLKGRTVEALRRRIEAWHRALRKQKMVAGGAWEGLALPDIAYEAGNEQHRAIWRFRQIKTGNDLFREGQAMHHCVVTYKGACMNGFASIWSLTCEFPIGKKNRGVTLEVRRDGRIVQVRGFANRRPHANEVAMVQRWADDHGLVLGTY